MDCPECSKKNKKVRMEQKFQLGDSDCSCCRTTIYQCPECKNIETN